MFLYKKTKSTYSLIFSSFRAQFHTPLHHNGNTCLTATNSLTKFWLQGAAVVIVSLPRKVAKMTTNHGKLGKFGISPLSIATVNRIIETMYALEGALMALQPQKFYGYDFLL